MRARGRQHNRAVCIDPLESRQYLAFSANINFQPAGGAYSGYLVDSGEVYAARGNGQTYGWATNDTAYTWNRYSPSYDFRYNTFAQMQATSNNVWEIAVPNGSYNVHIAAGDANSWDGYFKTNVENTLAIDFAPNYDTRFAEGNVTVNVTDGRLTVSNAAGASKNVINFIDISAVAPPAPTISVAPATVTEGNSGSTTLNFVVSLFTPVSQTVTVNYATLDGTALAGRDYTSASGTLTFLSGQSLSQTVSISVPGDLVAEPDRVMSLVLSNPTNVTLGSSVASGTIVDNDRSTLALSAATYTVNEAAKTIVYTVNRTLGALGDVTVQYATGGGTALAGRDYTATSGQLSWASGDSSSRTITVPILHNGLYLGSNKTFNLTLSGQSDNANLGANTVGATTITEAETPPANRTIKVLPLGDSLTDGYDVTGGYRTHLYSDLLGAGYTITLQGSASNNASGTLTSAGATSHEGHVGYQIDQILNNLDGSDGTAGNNGGFWFPGTGLRGSISPDFILLLVGTNDFALNNQTATAKNRLDALITRIVSDRPNAKLIVSNLIPRTDNATVEANIESQFNPYVPTIVASHQALGQKVYFANMNSWFGAADLSDGVHLNQSGFDRMGDLWFTAIAAAVNDAPVGTPKSLTTAQNTAVSGTLAATDTSSTTFTYTLQVAPQHGNVVVNSDGTFTYTPAGNYSGADSFKFKANDGALDSALATVSLTINSGTYIAPTVTATNDIWGNPRRVEFKFSVNVGASLGLADLQVNNLTTGQAVTPVSFSYDVPTSTVSFSFAAHLPLGNYRATLLASGVTDGLSNHLPSNKVLDFYSLPGDVNHDRHVDFSDLVALAQHYDSHGTATLADGDFNGDGNVDFADLVDMAQNYDAYLAPAAAAAVPDEAPIAPVSAESVVTSPEATAAAIPEPTAPAKPMVFIANRTSTLPKPPPITAAIPQPIHKPKAAPPRATKASPRHSGVFNSAKPVRAVILPAQAPANPSAARKKPSSTIFSAASPADMTLAFLPQ